MIIDHETICLESELEICVQGGITEHKAPFAHEHAEINELGDIVKELKYDDFYENDSCHRDEDLPKSERKKNWNESQANCPYRRCGSSKSVHRRNH